MKKFRNPFADLTVFERCLWGISAAVIVLSALIVGGADVTGTFLYFFISPFSFLFLIFGDGKVAHASSIVMLCKLMAIAFSGAFSKVLNMTLHLTAPFGTLPLKERNCQFFDGRQ